MAEHPSYASGIPSENATFNQIPKQEPNALTVDEIPPSDHPMTEVEVEDNGVKLEQSVKLETEEDQKTLLAVLQFLKKNNLARAAAVLEKEADTSNVSALTKTSIGETLSNAEVSSLLSAYSNEADPASYDDNYKMLQKIVESSLDANKWELAQLLYPVFVHMYLELVYNNHDIKARSFFLHFRSSLEDFHHADLQNLASVTSKLQMTGNNFIYSLRSNKFVIRISNESNDLLKRSLQEKNCPLVNNIIREHLLMEIFEGLPRTKTQIEASAGGMCGEPRHEENKAKVYYGLLKEPDIDIPLEDDDEPTDLDTTEGGTSKPKKKKKKEIFSKKNKADPNAPSMTRIPLPELKDADKLERITAAKESLKRVRLGGIDHVAPSVCCYTFTNSLGNVTALDICDDSSLLAAGFLDSHIRVWSLTPRSLRSVKSAAELSVLDKEGEDIFERMMDDCSGVESRTLYGHSGTVYSVSFSPCRTLLLSSSEDGTVRLWSLLTWANIMVYKGHVWSVWDCKFSPYGHYFVSCGQDRVARLWVTDHQHPVRIFAGHFSDVDCVVFHHNSNYIATGSSDNSVRVWDLLTGNCVRIFTGHKKPIMCLAWSPDGRYLASAGVDSQVLIWDIATKVMVGQFTGHTGTVHTLVFSRDGEVLASGSLDNTVKVWDFQQAIWDIDADDVGMHRGHATISDRNYLLSDYPTKSTPIYHLHFTRRNLLLAVGTWINPQSTT
uniref:Transcription initiation factor TFIID subunit 5 n=1 Tax=Phallusia mammillata TaxID=59560 RepID=A0A6F9DTM0_9ASCI|nr:transcription initiation factor TFIID subunit 5-like [Phallusia mammillata]